MNLTKNVHMPDMKKVHMPDMPSVSAPDVSGITGELKDLAAAAADAVSSAAGHVPGLDDYRAPSRSRRLLPIIGVVALALVVAAVVRRRQNDARNDARATSAADQAR